MRALSLVALAASAIAAPAADEVKSLPGWDKPLPSKHYSGYLNVDVAHHRVLHYYYVEAQTANPQDAPVVMWTNGGPGCSSMDGLFYEHGPLLVNEDGKTLSENPHAWSTVANMLYLEGPAGVGFSYSNVTADYKTGDNKTAYDNFRALQVFFDEFPELRKNEFYIAGESYGGVYVPTLAYAIYNHPERVRFNMTGFLVGNGVFGECEAEKDLPTGDPHTEFLHGHGMMSQKRYVSTVAACKDQQSKKCQDAMAEADAFSDATNPYDAYRVCYHNKQAKGAKVGRVSMANKAGLRAMRELPRPAHPSVGGEVVPCIDSTALTKYANRPDVRRALHVESCPNAWAICSSIIDYADDHVYASGMVPLYKVMSPHYRIAVYNGDVDPGCSYVMNEACVTSVKVPVLNDWRTWFYEDAAFGKQVGGWTTEYENDLHFVTIHGAGHMSPQWRPAQATHMFRQFLARKPF